MSSKNILTKTINNKDMSVLQCTLGTWLTEIAYTMSYARLGASEGDQRVVVRLGVVLR